MSDRSPPCPRRRSAMHRKLTAKHGPSHTAAIRTGSIRRVAVARERWRLSPRSASSTTRHASGARALFVKLQATVEQIHGHVLELAHGRWGTEVEDGPMMAVDQLLATYDIGAHVVDDLFTSKVASRSCSTSGSTLAQRSGRDPA